MSLHELAFFSTQITYEELDILTLNLEEHPSLYLLDFANVNFTQDGFDSYQGNLELIARLARKSTKLTHFYFYHDNYRGNEVDPKDQTKSEIKSELKTNSEISADLKLHLEEIRRGFVPRPSSIALRPRENNFFNMADLKICRFFPVDV